MGRLKGGHDRPKDPEAIPENDRGRGGTVSPKESDPSDEVEPVVRHRKRKDKGKRPLAAEDIDLIGDGVLMGVSAVYQMERGIELRYDPARKARFTKLLGELVGGSIMVPLWVQVLLSGAFCVGTAIVEAEYKHAADGAHVVNGSGQGGPSPDVSRAPTDRGGGEAGERKDVVDATLAR